MSVAKNKSVAAKKVQPKMQGKKTVAKAIKSQPAKKPASNVTLLKMVRPSLSSNLSIGGEKLPPRLQLMLDKSEISDILTSFARGIDRIDENLLRAVLHADATLDFGPGIFQGTGNDYVHWVTSVLQNVKSSHHMIGNIRIEMDGDSASVESYFNAHFRIEKPIGREDLFMGGRNLDRMERRPAGAGVWKIVHRKQILDWVRTEAVSDIFYHQNPDALWSYRTKTDPSYQMAQFPGSQSGGKLPAFLGRRYETKSVKF